MKTKAWYVCFIAVCLVVFLVPLGGMILAGSEQSIGNERTVSWPSFFKEGGKINEAFLKEAGNYLEHHFAFRSAMISADAKIQEKVFMTSNTDSVITGSEGWLYYSSTLSDYLGKDMLTERGINNLAHNLSLTQDYIESQGAKLLFMIAPNKNTLYGENMPYYDSLKYRDDSIPDRFRSAFEREGIPYLDLFRLFQSQGDVLYFREDSHWNNKGALMVYHEALKRFGKEHETYERAGVTRVKDHFGDLSAMIFPGLQSAEWDYYYDGMNQFEYAMTARDRSDTVSVESYHIETTCDSARGRLLMYRDSFGNSLIPFFANEYSHSVFSKTIPYKLASDLKAYHPEHVVIERVERNIRDLITSPPIIPAPEVDATGLLSMPYENMRELNRIDGSIDVRCDLCEADRTYVLFSGTLPRDMTDLRSQIYLKIGWPDGREATFSPYYLSGDETDYGFAAYLPVSMFGTLTDAQNTSLSVFVVT